MALSNHSEIHIKSPRSGGGNDEKSFQPAEYTILYDSLAAANSGRTANGEMRLDWKLRKLVKLTIKLPPHKSNDTKYSTILSLIQGQVVKVSYYDYLAHAEVTDQEMYCSKTNAGYSYMDIIEDVSFELIAMNGTNTIPHVDLTEYTITWKNWDNSTLATSTVVGGETPVYPGSTPTRPSTSQYNYTFSGWSPALGPVSANTSYTAQYSSTPVQYTITVTAGAHGSASGGGTYGYGSTATLTATPASGYVFSSWNDGNTSNPRTVTVTGDASYSCSFEEAPPPPSEYWELDWIDDPTFENDDSEVGTVWDVKGTSCPMSFISNNQNFTSISVDENGEFITYNSTDVWEGSGTSRHWNLINSNYRTMKFYSDPEYLFGGDWTDFLFNNLDGSIRHYVNGVLQ